MSDAAFHVKVYRRHSFWTPTMIQKCVKNIFYLNYLNHLLSIIYHIIIYTGQLKLENRERPSGVRPDTLRKRLLIATMFPITVNREHRDISICTFTWLAGGEGEWHKWSMASVSPWQPFMSWALVDPHYRDILWINITVHINVHLELIWLLKNIFGNGGRLKDL